MDLPLATRRKSPWLLTLLSVWQATMLLGADTEIRDQFSLTDRAGNLALNRTFTEKGALPWEATKNVVLGKEKGIVLSDSSPFVARVALSGNARVITLEAGLHPVLSAESAAKHDNNWVAVGFGHPDMGVPTWGQGIYLLVGSGGRFMCSFDPDPKDWTSQHAVSLGSGNVPEFNPNGMTKVKLQYDVKTKTVSIWVNAVQVVQNKALEADAIIDPAFAGFSGFSQSPNAPTVSSFAVTLAQ